MKKRLLGFLLAICMVLCNLPVTAMATEYQDTPGSYFDATILEEDDILCTDITVKATTGYKLIFHYDGSTEYITVRLNKTQTVSNTMSSSTVAGSPSVTTSTGKWIVDRINGKNIFLIPYVEPAAVTVTFNFNYDGCAEATMQNVGSDGKLASLPTPDPTREGYEFLGWFTATDETGTQITIDTEFAVDTQVYAHWKSTNTHTHSWAYAAAGNSIYAYCETSGCPDGYYKTTTDFTDSNLKYTISTNSVNDKIQYSGSEVSVSVDDKITETTGAEIAVAYYTNEECTAQTTETANGASAAGGAPKNVGSYWAAAAVGTAKATLGFEITPAAQSAAAIMDDYTYGSTPSTPTISGDVKENATVTYYYSTENSNTGGTVWNASALPALTVGTYYMYAKLAATTNYAEYTTATAVFNVSAAAMTGVSVSGYDNAYDGLEHGITVSAPSYATVKYGYSEGNYTLNTSPTYKNVSATPVDVYYAVTAPGYTTVTGHATVTIRKAAITVPDSAVTIAEKTYDGTDTATVSVSELDGVNNEKITVTGLTGAFDSADAGNSRTVTITDTGAVVKVGGEVTKNYVLTFPESKTAEIKQCEIGLTWSDTNLIYTGIEQTVAATPTNLVESEIVTLTYTGNTATAVGNYTAKVTGISSTNYVLPADASKEYSISYLTLPSDKDVTLSGTLGQNGWYTTDVVLTAPDGYVISASGGTGYSWQPSIKLSREGEQTYSYSLRKADTHGITNSMTKTVKIDKAAPTGDITVKTNSIKALLNTITFKYFFKDTVDVTITGSDGASGIANIEYQKVANGSTFSADGAWTPYIDTLSVRANDKSVYYARITDNAGHSVIINSDGVVVYHDTTSTAAHTYVLASSADLATDIDTRGSDIASISEGDALISADYYDVNASGKLVLKASYLHTLSVGTHTLTVKYNPLGIEYAANDIGINDAPGESTITLTIASYTVKYNTGDGAIAIADRQLTSFDAFVLDGIEKPSRQGYVFVGWKCGDSDVTESTKYSELAPNNTTESVTLTAQWFKMTVSATSLDFGTAQYGCAAPAGKTITVKNEGTVGMTVQIPATALQAFTVTPDTTFKNGSATLAAGAEATIAVVPKTGLSAGTYDSETFTIKGSYGVNQSVASVKPSFTVSQRSVTVAAGSCTVSKPYDGTLKAGTVSGKLAIAGILPTDNVIVEAAPDVYTNANVGGQTEINISISLKGEGKENYRLADSAEVLSVPCKITKKEISFTANAADRPYIKGSKAVDAAVTSFDGLVGEELLRVGIDYTINAETDSDNTGTDKPVTIMIRLLDTVAANNYRLKTDTAAATVNIYSADQSVPPAPTLKSRTKHEIVLNALPDNAESGSAVQYSIDGGKTWQDSPRFVNLSVETDYIFYARYKGSENYRTSRLSSASFSTISRSGTAYDTIHIYAGEHGSAEPSGTLMVRDGGDRKIEFIPDTGYEVADVVVNHKSVGAVSAYTVKSVDGNVNVEVTFVKSGNAVVSSTVATKNPATGVNG